MPARFAYLHTACPRALAAAEAVVLVLHRREVAAGRVGRLADRLLALSDDAILARRFEGRLHLVFEGYAERTPDRDPACRRFFRALTDQWPYWFHFLERRDGSLGHALLLLVDAVELHGPDAAPARVFDPALLDATVRGMLDGLAGLHDALCLDARHTDRVSAGVLQAVGLAAAR